MKPTVDIVEELVNGFVPTSKITDVTDNLDGTFTIEVCNTLNIREQSTFTINAVEYTATSVNTSTRLITYESITAPTKGQYIVGVTPFYFHGTPIAVGNELSKLTSGVDKFPMVYLLEVVTDKFNTDEESPIERESTVNLFFLDEANFADWDTGQHYSDAIVPMANYAKSFIEYLDDVNNVGQIDNYDLTYHAKFGLNIKTSSGHLQNLFPENLSGCQLRITLPILKSLSCQNKC